MLKCSIFFSCILFLFAFSACNTDDTQTGDTFNTQFDYRTIKFTVTDVYNISPVQDSAVAGATISIYDDFYDFEIHAYPDASRTTDSTGYAEIGGLLSDFYYIRVEHPAFPDIIDSVNTPAGTTSFVYLNF